jgi:hypothetical protein
MVFNEAREPKEETKMEENLMENITEEAVEVTAKTGVSNLTKIAAGVGIGGVIISGIAYGTYRLIKSRKSKKDNTVVDVGFDEKTVMLH